MDREGRGFGPSSVSRVPATWRSALTTVAAYAILATLWIMTSDTVSRLFTVDPDLLTAVAILKGILFVAVTSVLLFVLIRRDLERLRRTAMQQRLLARGADALRAATAPSRAWMNLASVVRDILGCDAAEVWNAEEDGSLVSRFVTTGMDVVADEASQTPARRLTADDPHVGWMWDRGARPRPASADSIGAPELEGGEPLVSALALPVRRADDLLGAIVVWSRRSCDAGDALIDTLGQLADQLADTLERFRLESSLQRQALYDELTGLPNRALLGDRLEAALLQARFARNKFMVVMCQIDMYDLVSQSHGHDQAERLILESARRLEAVISPRDTLARSHSDEFTIIATDVHDADTAALYLDQIEHVIAEPVEVGLAAVPSTVSLGVHMATGEMDSHAVLRDVVTALRRARIGGRGKRVFFDSAMRDSVEGALRTELELRDAIELEQFELYFQPLIAASSRSICGAESLVRWRHPTRGLLDPIDFIQVAEETGLIVGIGRQVIQMACRACAKWPTQPGCQPFVAVNLSAPEFIDAGLERTILDALAASGLEPEHLGLEITETAVMSNPEQAGRIIRRLRQIGVRVAVDDFGTGYSSLAYLKRFDIDMVKVDRTFVRGVPQDNDDNAITRAIVDMSHALGLSAIAEGVERQNQVKYLTDLGYDLLQGYLFSRPVDAEEFARLLAVQGAAS